MKKWFAFLLILALTLTSAFALAEQTTITMSTWLATEDGTKAVYQEMLDDFMAANPDIKVEVIALPFNQNKDQVLLAELVYPAPVENAEERYLGMEITDRNSDGSSDILLRFSQGKGTLELLFCWDPETGAFRSVPA